MMLEELVDIEEQRLNALNIPIRQKERIAKAYNKRLSQRLLNLLTMSGR